VTLATGALPMCFRMYLTTLLLIVWPSSAQQRSWVEVLDRILPAVVVVETEKGQGSGFFVRRDGTLVTNHHVISGVTQIAVRTKSGEEYRGAFVMASDELRDLAILRVEAFDVPVVALGNSNELKAGAAVLLVGAPRGLERSASEGIVAAIRADEKGTRLIQTSAAASPGSSGGPVLNEAGEVVGVLSFTVTQSQNLNFAVPINYARGMLDRLAAVASQPERRLTALPAASEGVVSLASAPSRSREAREAGGIYVTGFGPSEYLQQVYLELTEVLAASAIRVVELHEVQIPGQFTSISGHVAAARKATADGLLYFSLSTGWGETDRLRVQFFDRDGKLLWQDETTSMWQGSIQGAVNAVTKRMKEKLRVRVRKRQFPKQN